MEGRLVRSSLLIRLVIGRGHRLTGTLLRIRGNELPGHRRHGTRLPFAEGPEGQIGYQGKICFPIFHHSEDGQDAEHDSAQIDDAGKDVEQNTQQTESGDIFGEEIHHVQQYGLSQFRDRAQDQSLECLTAGPLIPLSEKSDAKNQGAQDGLTDDHTGKSQDGIET